MITRRAVVMALLAKPAVRLHTGTYGLQALDVETAIEQVRAIGYDGIELCLMSGWPRPDPGARRRIRESKFPVPSVMESFHLTDPDQGKILDRLLAAAEVAHDVGATILQTVPGGKPEDWDGRHALLVKNLSAWAATAEREKIRLAIKGHLDQAVDTPAKLLRIVEEVGNPALTVLYDHSHYEPQGLSIADTVKQVLPRSAFITVKDAKLVNGHPQFLLPGEGTTDYDAYFRLLRTMQWSGWMLTEVSRQLQVKPGYDGVAAARKSYEFVAAKLHAAGLR